MESRQLTRANELLADVAEALPGASRETPYWEDDPTIEYGADCAPISTDMPSPLATRVGVGARIRGRYVVESVVGIGGTAIVYRARDARRERGAPFAYVALKIPRHGSGESLAREFRIAQLLTHPNILRVFDLDRVGDAWFMVTELLEGEPLTAALERHRPGALPAALATRVLCACSAALQFAHERGIVHGDFKPGNVLIPHGGEIRVLDFGAAVDADLVTGARCSPQQAAPAATHRYASPQVLAGERPEVRDDVFSFACVCHEVLTGTHPFGQRSASEARAAGLETPIAPQLDPAPQQLLRRALAWEREARPASVAEIARALSARPAVTERGSIVLQPAREPGWLRPMVVASALATLGGLTLFVGWATWPDSGDKPERGAFEAAVAGEATVAAATTLPALTEAVEVDAGAVRGAAQPLSRSAPEAGSAAVESPLPVAAAQPAAPAAAPRYSEISFETALQTVSEGASAAAVMLTRSGGRSGTVQVRWRTVARSASSPSDYEAIGAGVARFAEGQMRRVLFVPLRADDVPEGDETFAVELYDPSGRARIGTIGVVTIRVNDDDR